VIREPGNHASGAGREPAAAWPTGFSSPVSPPATAAAGSRAPFEARDREVPVRDELPQGSHGETDPVPRPVRRAVLRGHVALRHLPPRDPE
jgi:hypothetical protein